MCFSPCAILALRMLTLRCTPIFTYGANTDWVPKAASAYLPIYHCISHYLIIVLRFELFKMVSCVVLLCTECMHSCVVERLRFQRRSRLQLCHTLTIRDSCEAFEAKCAVCWGTSFYSAFIWSHVFSCLALCYRHYCVRIVISISFLAFLRFIA